VADLVERVIAHFGRVDILANIAGGFAMGPPVHETEDKDWDFMMDLNARSVFNTCRAAVPHMIARGSGRIVNVSARAAREGKAHMAPYCASKAAVITLTESLAAELKDHGINANCILPGTIDTPQNRAAMPDADVSRWVPTAALADVILFLASNASAYVTGAAVPVYGRG
jgi:NAD(P)-dependent dehydrogenase (short-subunit alcohol dehydrogenase family)